MKKVAIGLLVCLAFLVPGANVEASSNHIYLIRSLKAKIRMLQEQVAELENTPKKEEVVVPPQKEEPKKEEAKPKQKGFKLQTARA